MHAIYVGHDWAEDHHDIHIDDADGSRLHAGRVPEGVEGVTRLHAVIADLVDDPHQVLIASETDRGLFIGAMLAAGYDVIAINPIVTKTANCSDPSPGLGTKLAARLLGEFGDAPNRFADARSRKNFAGTSPITKASGRSHIVIARRVRNSRIADTCHQWAFPSLSHSPGARAFYDQRRSNGDSHNRALRALSNRLVGIAHGCLDHRTAYNEHTAWGHRTDAPT